MSDRQTLETDPATSRRLARVRQRNTAPEEGVARMLRELGVSYRRRNRDLPGSPDFANRSRRWAMFVHGCFWHGHSCGRYVPPKRNAAFWATKLATNRARDTRVVRELRRAGFLVVVIWECSLRERSAMMAKLLPLRPVPERSARR